MASVPIFRYSSCCTTTDAQTVRPYRSRIALLETDALHWTLPVRPYGVTFCFDTTEALLLNSIGVIGVDQKCRR